MHVGFNGSIPAQAWPSTLSTWTCIYSSLKSLNNLCELDVHGSGFDHEIDSAILQMPSLHKTDLSRNKLRDEYGMLLQELDISNYFFTILPSIAYTPSLSTFRFYYNFIRMAAPPGSVCALPSLAAEVLDNCASFTTSWRSRVSGAR